MEDELMIFNLLNRKIILLICPNKKKKFILSY